MFILTFQNTKGVNAAGHVVALEDANPYETFEEALAVLEEVQPSFAHPEEVMIEDIGG